MGRVKNPDKLLLVGGAVVDPRTKLIIERMARAEKRSIAQVLRQLIEESPRVKTALKSAKQ